MGTFTVDMAPWLSVPLCIYRERHGETDKETEGQLRDRDIETERDRETQRYRNRERETERHRNRDRKRQRSRATEKQKHRETGKHRDRAVTVPSWWPRILARLTLVLRRCRGLRSHGCPHKHTVLPAESLVDQRDTFSRRKKLSLEALTPSPLSRDSVS